MRRPLSVDAICNLINALLHSGYPAIEHTAALLRVSTRTLQRLLNEEGASYAELVDRCRCKVACDSLEQTQKSIHDIAAALGYRDASSFSRAFRRWTGTAPRAYRNQSLGQHQDRSAQAGQRNRATQ